MPPAHTHRHNSASGRSAGHCGSRRSGSNSESRAAPATRPASKTKERTGSRRSDLPGAPSAGKNAAALCALSAFLGLGITAISEIVSRASNEHPLPVFNVLAAAATLVALATGVFAQTTQLRHWSRRIKRRLLVGLPVALLTALVVTGNFFERPVPAGAHAPVDPRPARALQASPEDNAVVKTGWYGELQQDGLLIAVSSFGDASAETKQFCRRLSKPVAYASLSLINLGAPAPAVLSSLEVGLHTDTGKELLSLAVRPLLEQQAAANADLLQRLKVPLTLAAGTMLADLPICQAPGFDWARVTAVSVSLSARTVTIPGRLMTADEKQALLSKSAVKRPSPGTNATAEAWFNTL